MDKGRALGVTTESYLAGSPKHDPWWMMPEGSWGYLRRKRQRSEKKKQQEKTSTPGQVGRISNPKSVPRRSNALRRELERYVSVTS